MKKITKLQISLKILLILIIHSSSIETESNPIIIVNLTVPKVIAFDKNNFLIISQSNIFGICLEFKKMTPLK